MPKKIMEAIEEFEKIKNLAPKWEGLKASGSISLTHSEKLALEEIYFNHFHRSFCKHCSEAVAEAFTAVFRLYDRTMQQDEYNRQAEIETRSKRPRIAEYSSNMQTKIKL